MASFIILSMILAFCSISYASSNYENDGTVLCGSYEGRIQRLLSYCCQGYMYMGKGTQYNQSFSMCERNTYKYSLADLLGKCTQFAGGSQEALAEEDRELETRLYLCDPATKPKLQIKGLSKCYIEAVPKLYEGTDLSYFEDYTLSVLLPNPPVKKIILEISLKLTGKIGLAGFMEILNFWKLMGQRPISKGSLLRRDLKNCYWQTYNMAPDMSLTVFPNI